MSAILRPRFYGVIALALALFAVIAFSRTYYFRFLTGLPPLPTVVQLHAAVFTAWLVLFVVQTRLIAAHRVDLHRKLGIAGVGLAMLMIGVSFATLARKAVGPFIHPSGLTAPQFTVVCLMSLVLFAAFIALGLAFRKRGAWHKRFMVLAMIAVLTPPSSRILTMLGLREYWTTLVPVMPTLFIVWCLVYDWVKHRIVHPVFAIGGLVVTAAWPLRLVIGRADWYQPVGEWIVGLGTGVAS